MPTETLDALDLTFALPDDADGLQELLGDQARMSEVWKAAQANNADPVAAWAAINGRYQELARAKDKGEQEEQMLIQLEERTHDMARDNGMGVGGPGLNLTPEALTAHLAQVAQAQRSPTVSKHYQADAPGAAVESVFGSWSNAVRSVIHEANPRDTAGWWKDTNDLLANLSKARQISADYSSHIGPSGGVLMPESFRTELLQHAHESAVVRSRATTIRMSTPKLTIPAIHETSRSSTLFGGIQMYWTEEDADSTISDARFKTISLEPDTLTGYTEIPNETLLDAIAFGSLFDATFPLAMAFEEDYAFLQGNGVGQPLGVLNGDGVITVAARSGQAADTLVYENLLDMWARMPPTSMGRAVWLMNQDVIPELGTMALSVGTGGAPIFLMNAANGMPMTVFGRPIIFTEKVNELGTAGDVALVDFGFYLIGDLQTVTVSSSSDYKFKERKQAFLITERVDGQPWINKAVTPRHGTNTLSPYVTLATRA